ncbi:MAG: GNAT family N-acetyltransferase [Armatimonadota bacterium]
MIRRLEEMSMNAWPSQQQVLLDGWVLRFAEGYTRRANSVHPMYPGEGSVTEKIARCEAIYREQDLPVIFKISPIIEPPLLDGILERQGYALEATTSVQTVDLASVDIDAIDLHKGNPVRISGDIEREWLLAYASFVGVERENSLFHRRIIDRIAHPKCLATVMQGHFPVACGLGVLDLPYVGLYDIVTAPSCRGCGFATRIIAAIFAWARSFGATHSYLQVMADNTPALNLYAKLGYAHQYAYWYRVKMVDG